MKVPQLSQIVRPLLGLLPDGSPWEVHLKQIVAPWIDRVHATHCSAEDCEGAEVELAGLPVGLHCGPESGMIASPANFGGFPDGSSEAAACGRVATGELAEFIG